MGSVGIKNQQLHGLGTLQGTRDPMGRGPHRGSHWTRGFQERQQHGQIMGMSDAGFRGKLGFAVFKVCTNIYLWLVLNPWYQHYNL